MTTVANDEVDERRDRNDRSLVVTTSLMRAEQQGCLLSRSHIFVVGIGFLWDCDLLSTSPQPQNDRIAAVNTVEDPEAGQLSAGICRFNDSRFDALSPARKLSLVYPALTVTSSSASRLPDLNQLVSTTEKIDSLVLDLPGISESQASFFVRSIPPQIRRLTVHCEEEQLYEGFVSCDTWEMLLVPAGYSATAQRSVQAGISLQLEFKRNAALLHWNKRGKNDLETASVAVDVQKDKVHQRELEIAKLQQSLDTELATAEKLRLNVDDAREQIAQRDKVIETLQFQRDEDNSEIVGLRAQLNRTEQSFTDLQQQYKAEIKDIPDLLPELTQRENSIASLQLQREEDKKEIAVVREDLRKVQKSKLKARETCKQQAEQLKTLNARLEKVELQKAAKSKQLSETENRYELLEKQLAEIRSRLKRKEDSAHEAERATRLSEMMNAKLQADLDALRDDYRSRVHELRQLTDLVSQLQSKLQIAADLYERLMLESPETLVMLGIED